MHPIHAYCKNRIVWITVLATLFISTTIAPALSTAQSLPTLGDTEHTILSPLKERKLGEKIMRDKIRPNANYLDDEPLLEYLNHFGTSLVSAHPEVRGEAAYNFSFFIVRDPTLNAFALPGGFIAVHSGLLIAAQNESELASVLAHEIGHVAQRHLARGLAQQQQASMIQLTAIVLGALAGLSKIGGSGDLPAAIWSGGTGVAQQKQLNFSRDAEREADRVGLQILQAGGFDTAGMVAFFKRLQTATRYYSDVIPPYLLTHPLTTERVADIQARIVKQASKQHIDSPDFQLVRARARVLQDTSAQGLDDAQTFFEAQHDKHSKAAALYGLAYIAYQQKAYHKAQALLQQAHEAGIRNSFLFANLNLDIQLAQKHHQQALEVVHAADAMRKQFPLSRVIAHQYAAALIANQCYNQAVAYLRIQAQSYRQDGKIHYLLAQAYEGQNKQALLHIALAQSYALTDNILTALDQLNIARRAPDATFYDQAIIDARERELKAYWQQENQE